MNSEDLADTAKFFGRTPLAIEKTLAFDAFKDQQTPVVFAYNSLVLAEQKELVAECLLKDIDAWQIINGVREARKVRKII